MWNEYGEWCKWCPECHGAGSVEYVDEFGDERLVLCPECHGECMVPDPNDKNRS